jgi:hypothetical protein
MSNDTPLKSPYAWTAPGWRSEMPSGEPDAEEIWCYADRFSYVAGDVVDIHVHTTAATYNLEIVRDGLHPETVLRREGLPGVEQVTNAEPYAQGCGWEVSLRVPVEPTWRAGLYLVIVRFVDHAGAPFEREGFFVVRSGPERASAVLVLTTSTMTAYNDWGGANHYRGLSEDPRADVHSPILSTRRPVARGMLRLPVGAPREGQSDTPEPFAIPRYRAKEWARLTGRSRHYASAFWATYERHFVVWAEAEAYTFDYVTQQDLHTDPGCLDGYDCAIVVGHDEYWSWRMRDTLDAFLERGGNLARFAGNFEWQVRLEEDGTRQLCYKARATDPTPDPHLTTIVWDHPMIGRPAAQSIGLTGAAGIYTRYGGATPRSSGGFTVYRPDHWIFEGTDLYYGDTFGAVPVAVAAFEVDGVEYTFRKGLPYPTFEDGAPEDLEILAMCPAVVGEVDRWGGTVPLNAPADEFREALAEHFEGYEMPEYLKDRQYGCGMVAACTRGRGTVVNAGSTDWVSGLDHRDPYVERITHNILRRLGTGRGAR